MPISALPRLLARRSMVLLALGLAVLGILASATAAHAGRPYYHIISQYSGKVLMPENHSKDAGTRIVQMAPGNYGAQHWFIDRELDYSNGQTIRQFRNRHSKYCIYVKYEDHAEGRILHQDQCEKNYNANARQWVVSSKADMWAGRPFTMWNRNSAKCMDVYGWSLADYGELVQWSCHGGANQQFRLGYRGTSG